MRLLGLILGEIVVSGTAVRRVLQACRAKASVSCALACNTHLSLFGPFQHLLYHLSYLTHP